MKYSVRPKASIWGVKLKHKTHLIQRCNEVSVLNSLPLSTKAGTVYKLCKEERISSMAAPWFFSWIQLLKFSSRVSCRFSTSRHRWEAAGVVVTSSAPASLPPGCKYWLRRLLQVLSPQAVYFSSSCLQFLIYRMEVITVTTSRFCEDGMLYMSGT